MERTQRTTDRPTPGTTRHATARQLANEGLSNRAIARQLGVHHNTVARWLATPADPDAPATEPQDEPARASSAPPDAPPPPTSGTIRTPQLLHPLPAWLIQDLNILTDPFTGRLLEPVARAIHEAAEERRTRWRANVERRQRQNAAVAQ